MRMKHCISCDVVKEEKDFNRDKGRLDGLQVYCRECTRLKVKASYWKDVKSSRDKSKMKEYNTSDKKKLYGSIYYRDNKEQIALRVSTHRKDPEVKSRLLKYNNELEKRRMNEDPKFRMIRNLRTNIRYAINKYTDSGKTRSCAEYGIDFDAIFSRLGGRPSTEHELDHIIPLTKFDLSNPEHVRLAHLPCNLRWITSTENKSKSNKIPESAYVDEELIPIMMAIGLLE